MRMTGLWDMSWIAGATGSSIAGLFVAPVASAQITVPITGYQVGTSAPASPNAAYSNITNYLGATNGVGAGISATLFSNLTAAPVQQGQTVQALRLGVTCRGVVGTAPIRRSRVQVGFWNADGPNGTAGTPVHGLGGFAQYQSDPLSMPVDQAAIITLNLGTSGFVVPTGRFYFGIAYDVREFTESSSIDFACNVYGTPSIGMNQPGLYVGEYNTDPPTSVFGIPWGAAFGVSPYLVYIDSPRSVGIELIVPAPSSGALMALSGAFVFRRRRS